MSSPTRVLLTTLSAGADFSSAFQAAASVASGAERRRLEAARAALDRGEDPRAAIGAAELHPPLLADILCHARSEDRPYAAELAERALTPPSPAERKRIGWTDRAALWTMLTSSVGIIGSVVLSIYVLPVFMKVYRGFGRDSGSPGIWITASIAAMALGLLIAAVFGGARALQRAQQWQLIVSTSERPMIRVKRRSVGDSPVRLMLWLAAGQLSGLSPVEVLGGLARAIQTPFRVRRWQRRTAPDTSLRGQLDGLGEAARWPQDILRIARHPLLGETSVQALERAAKLLARRPSSNGLHWPVILALGLNIFGAAAATLTFWRLLYFLAEATPWIG